MLTRAGLRAFSTEALKVANDVAKQRFVVSMKGAEAVLGYQLDGNKITFTNTEVPEQFQGKGVGKLLAKAAFDDAQSKNLDVTCQCHFLAKFYNNNKSKYQKLRIKMDLD